MPRFSIRTLLILSILLPLSTVYTVFVVIEARVSRSEAIRDVEFRLAELTNKRALRVDGYFAAAEHIPKTLSAVLSAKKVQSEEDIDAILREVLTAFPRVIGSCIAFEPNAFREGLEQFAPFVYRSCAESVELFSVNLAETFETDYKDADWYRIPEETKRPAWSEPYFDDGGAHVLMCTYSAPFFRDGSVVGIVTLDLCLDALQDVVLRQATEGVTYYLLSASGSFVIVPESEKELEEETIFTLAEKHDSDQLRKIGNDLKQGVSGILQYDRILNEHPRVRLAYAPLPISGWSLISIIPESLVLAPVHARLYRSVSRFFIVLAVLSTLIVIVSWRLTAPIKRLAKFAQKLATGDLDTHIGDVRLAREIDQLAHALDKMADDLKSHIEQRIKEEAVRRTVEGELTAARRVQASLLPRVFPPFPDRTEFDLHAVNEPMAGVAGDFFDFFFIGPDTLVIVLADVSGHGIPAALFMAVSRTVIRKFTVPEQSPREIIDNVNQVLSQDNDDVMFVTLFYGHYDTKTGELTYVNAGHNPPYVVRKDGSLDTLPPTGPFVAAFEEILYEERTVRLESGDVLVTFTDGVTEAHSSRDHILYGEERLERLLREIRGESVTEICARICRDVEEFSAHEQQDDATLLVLRRNDR